MTAQKNPPLFFQGTSSESKYQKVEIPSLYRALKVQRDYAPTASMCYCGLTPIQNQGAELIISNKGARFGGMQTCGSQWCVTCQAQKKDERKETINRGLETAKDRGYHRYFMTLTIPRSNDPRQQIADLQKGWKGLQDKISYRLKRQNNQMYFVRNHDVTFKISGGDIFHQHLHIIIILKNEFDSFTEFRKRSMEDYLYFSKQGYKFSDKEKLIIESWEQFLMVTWYDVQKKNDLQCSLNAQDVQKVGDDKESADTLSKYLVKFWSLGHELACFTHKKGKTGKLINEYGSIGYMQLLGFIDKGSKKAIQIYRDFLIAVKGLRTMGKSQNWKLLAPPVELAPDMDDKEIKLSLFVHPVYWHILSNRRLFKGYSGYDSVSIAVNQIKHLPNEVLKGILLFLEEPPNPKFANCKSNYLAVFQFLHLFKW